MRWCRIWRISSLLSGLPCLADAIRGDACFWYCLGAGFCAWGVFYDTLLIRAAREYLRDMEAVAAMEEQWEGE